MLMFQYLNQQLIMMC